MKSILCFMFCLALLPLHAQKYSLSYRQGVGGGSYTPFYLLNNRDGVIPTSPTYSVLQVGFTQRLVSPSGWRWYYGVKAWGCYDKAFSFYLQEAYAAVNYRAWGIWVGSREEASLWGNDVLSSGSMVLSRNSRPIPQIAVGIPQFTPLPFTRGHVEFKAMVSYGWFTDGRMRHDEGERYASGVRFHRKWLLLRSSPHRPFWGTIGIDMAAQFAGKVYLPDGRVVRFPATLTSYLQVLIPQAGGEDAPQIDQVNVTGNHVGSYLLEMGYRLSPQSTLHLYHEHYFDDHSGMIFKNRWDGRWGISLELGTIPWLESFVLEYLETRHQSGAFLWDKSDAIPCQVSGGDDYYNHGIYPGWSHWGRGLGSPLVASPCYTPEGHTGFWSSRITALHMGAMGRLSSSLSYRFLAHLQHNWGTPRIPLSHVEKNLSLLLELGYTPPSLKGVVLKGAFALDRGELLGNNWGCELTLCKSGRLW